MEKRKGKIIWVKSGSGSDTVRVTIPVSWIRDIDITKEQREIELGYDRIKKEIILKKYGG